jgi:HEAT repeat protein
MMMITRSLSERILVGWCAVVSATSITSAQSSVDLKPTREVIGAIGSHRLTVPVSQMADFLAVGLLDSDPLTRETSLFAIAGRAGSVFLKPSPDRVTEWQTERPTLLGLRDRVVSALDDPDERVRGAAALALANLSYAVDGQRPDMRLGDDTLGLFTIAYRKEMSGFNRGEIVKIVALAADRSEVHRQLLVDALNDDHDAAIANAVMGIAEMRLPEALDTIVGLSAHTSRMVRLMVAQAVGRYGQQAAPYLDTLRKALPGESDEVVRKTLAASIGSIESGK